MPSNRNNGKRKPRKPLDTEVSMELEEFEYNFCKYVDTAMPRKFRDTYVKQILSALGEAAKCTLKGLRYDAAFFALEKKFQFENALSELDYVSTRLNRMNDFQTISDDVKAQLDMKLYDIKDGLERLSNSLRKCAASQVSAGTPDGEDGGLEGCPTNYENG